MMGGYFWQTVLCTIIKSKIMVLAPLRVFYHPSLPCTRAVARSRLSPGLMVSS